MNFLGKRLQGKLVTSISKENDVCIVAFDDGTAMTVNTAVSPWFVAEAEPPRVTDFVRRDHGYRIILAGQSISIFRQMRTLSSLQKYFIYVDADGQWIVETLESF
ncbi:MAG: hypothetical protein EOQ42_26945 [Mesorhizobium sp.]|uniref:hypothetical protein n=1 Tax=unclassified Mesorhizobium TaxID=325217 RepID=UPI000FE45A1C|nr:MULTISPECIES: hypothetical protein [unclassified Mesorhizobium]RWB30510.1 MAG: hypothetical protein EOQ43_15280 [Mesorhizobium sp.]RWB50491.1 MAG: hypothetical protein EOQ42_26945 [Mesorhizobium sp.]RWC08538.1 MAG: hypothetical protein EOS51_25570 [Mesorhizobium sp.]RWC32479.1 MAG: hypothetical protein EOS70_17405 [Mesorhizobium sp.]RWD11261.1 MAG: hypothetical protein EOS57_21965 [Mesorhizobium sp.]